MSAINNDTKADGKGVTSYRYNPDGSVTHTIHGRRLSVPLSAEEAGGEPCTSPSPLSHLICVPLSFVPIYMLE